MKTRILTLAFLLSASYLLTSCKENPTNTTTAVPTESNVVSEEIKEESIDLSFASAGYATKEEGSDWVKIDIKSSATNQVTILITSREDIKKPTCSLETIATKLNDNTYQAVLQEVKVNFTLEEGQLAIDTVNESDRGVLSYYCSGGGSLLGTYSEIK